MSIRLVDADSLKDASAIPAWIATAFRPTDGRDPLGLQSITIDRIMPRLVPSVLALSRRARYFSVYTFLLDEVFRHQPTASQDELSGFVKAREYDYALAVQLCPRGCGQTASAVVGGLKAGPKVRSGAESFQRAESVESYLGGYGLYYRTPLVELGLVAPRGEFVPAQDEPLPRDVLRPGLGFALAERFRAAVADSAYYPDYFFGTQPIPKTVLVDLAERVCLCRLGDHPLERSAIREAVIGLPSPTPDSAASAERRGLAEQRRRSFAIVLWAFERDPSMLIDGGNPTSKFRRVVWTEFERTLGDQTELAGGLAQWAALVGKDYLQDALATIWSDFCRRGRASQPADGMPPEEVSWFLTHGLLDGTTVDLGTGSLAVASSTPTRTWAAEISSRSAGQSLEDLRGWVVHQNTAAAGLAFLLALRNRLTERVIGVREWRAIAGQSSNWQPGLLGTIAALDAHLEEDPALGDTLAWVAHRFVVDVHERVAYSKLPDFTFRFRWEEDRLRFYDRDASRFEPTDIRLDAITRLSRDLGLLDPAGETGVLTAEGTAFVAGVLG